MQKYKSYKQVFEFVGALHGANQSLLTHGQKATQKGVTDTSERRTRPCCQTYQRDRITIQGRLKVKKSFQSFNPQVYGLTMNPWLYNVTRMVILSAFSGKAFVRNKKS